MAIRAENDQAFEAIAAVKINISLTNADSIFFVPLLA